jgi:hypothetical protein
MPSHFFAHLVAQAGQLRNSISWYRAVATILIFEGPLDRRDEGRKLGGVNLAAPVSLNEDRRVFVEVKHGFVATTLAPAGVESLGDESQGARNSLPPFFVPVIGGAVEEIEGLADTRYSTELSCRCQQYTVFTLAGVGVVGSS